MPRTLPSLLTCALLAACGTPRTTPPTTSSLALTLGDPVSVEAGQTLLVQVVVLGDDGRQVTLTGQSLPSFATLSGHQLRLAPTREDSPGTYSVTLRASAGTDSATSTLAVTVLRPNTAPWLGTLDFYEDGHLKCACFYGNFDGDCRFASDPELVSGAWDPEGDHVLVELEFREAGTPLQGVATHSVADPYDRASGGLKRLRLAGLASGATYTMALRICDALGACVDRSDSALFTTFPHALTALDGGWLLVGSVGHSPAPTGCTKGVAGQHCSANGDCCSGHCDLTTTTPWGPGAVKCDDGVCL